MGKSEGPEPPEVIQIPMPWPPFPEKQRFEVIVDLSPLHGRYECTGVMVRSVDRKQVVTGSLLRELPIATLATRAVALADDLGYPALTVRSRSLNFDSLDTVTQIGQLSDERQAIEQAKKIQATLSDTRMEVGVRRYPPDYLQHVAAVYQDAVLAHLPPTRTVAETLFGGNRKAAGNQVARARKAGLLPPTERGKASPPAKPSSKKGKS